MSSCPNKACEPLLRTTTKSSSFSGMFTISDAVMISSLLLMDEGLFPQERKSGVALCRRDEGTAEQEDQGGGAWEITRIHNG